MENSAIDLDKQEGYAKLHDEENRVESKILETFETNIDSFLEEKNDELNTVQTFYQQISDSFEKLLSILNNKPNTSVDEKSRKDMINAFKQKEEYQLYLLRPQPEAKPAMKVLGLEKFIAIKNTLFKANSFVNTWFKHKKQTIADSNKLFTKIKSLYDKDFTPFLKSKFKDFDDVCNKYTNDGAIKDCKKKKVE